MEGLRVSDSIKLTALRESDLEDLVFQINDPVIYENTLTVPHPYTLEHAHSFLEHVRAFEHAEGIQKDWVIRVEERLAGGIGALYNYGVHAHKTEIGYWLSRDYRGQGIMGDIIAAFVRHLFTASELLRLEAHVFVGNISSARVLEKNHFVLEATARAAFVKNGIPRDSWQYALLKEEYLKKSGLGK